jgi:hypothetical protein
MLNRITPATNRRINDRTEYLKKTDLNEAKNRIPSSHNSPIVAAAVKIIPLNNMVASLEASTISSPKLSNEMNSPLYWAGMKSGSMKRKIIKLTNKAVPIMRMIIPITFRTNRITPLALFSKV